MPCSGCPRVLSHPIAPPPAPKSPLSTPPSHVPPSGGDSIRSHSPCWHIREHVTMVNNILAALCIEIADHFIFAAVLFIAGTVRYRNDHGFVDTELLPCRNHHFRNARLGNSYTVEKPALWNFHGYKVCWVRQPVDHVMLQRTHGLNYVLYGPDSAVTEA